MSVGALLLGRSTSATEGKFPRLGFWRDAEKTYIVMLSPFAIPLRTALSAAKGLRVNFAKHPRSALKKRNDSDPSRSLP
ncbi:MAG: hypothetical protein DMG22_08440 [Acidobacteria bacterium]|nr:MAG: hypothetical protein DMG22_08440 [Acidobacteriota bacterium]